ALLDAASELAGHVPLLERERLNDEPDDDGGLGEVLDAEDLRLVHEERVPLRVLGEAAAEFAEHVEDAVDVVAVRDPEVQHGAGPRLRQVADACDLAVRDHVYGALEVP